MSVLFFDPQQKDTPFLTVLKRYPVSLNRVDNWQRFLQRLEKAQWWMVNLDGRGIDESQLTKLAQVAREYHPRAILFLTSQKRPLPFNYSYLTLSPFASEQAIRNFLTVLLGHSPVEQNGEATPSLTILTNNRKMKKILAQVEEVKDTQLIVLLTGETGTGKTIIARHIHNSSSRTAFPFMHINCAAIPEHLLEAELFGYKKGAFTGAYQDQEGKFQSAGQGTILLDEIGEIPQHLQAKLLKVLDENEFFPVGGTTPERVQARIITATNKDLNQAVKEKKFRQDLFYRINSLVLHIPPLRERKEDIALLFDHFLKREAHKQNAILPQVDAAVYELLRDYLWPGNIRELENLARMLFLPPKERLSINDLPEHFFNTFQSKLLQQAERLKTLEEVKKSYARYVMERVGHKKMEAAALLGINIKTLNKLLS